MNSFSTNKGFEMMIPKHKPQEKEDFNYKVQFKLFNRTFSLSIQVK